MPNFPLQYVALQEHTCKSIAQLSENCKGKLWQEQLCPSKYCNNACQNTEFPHCILYITNHGKGFCYI